MTDLTKEWCEEQARYFDDLTNVPQADLYASAFFLAATVLESRTPQCEPDELWAFLETRAQEIADEDEESSGLMLKAAGKLFSLKYQTDHLEAYKRALTKRYQAWKTQVFAERSRLKEELAKAEKFLRAYEAGAKPPASVQQAAEDISSKTAEKVGSMISAMLAGLYEGAPVKTGGNLKLIEANRDWHKRRADNHWETLKSIRHIARTSGDLDSIIQWVNDAGSGYTESADITIASLIDSANEVEEALKKAKSQRDQVLAELDVWALNILLDAADRTRDLSERQHRRAQVARLRLMAGKESKQ